MDFVCLNGRFLPAGENLFNLQNRGFRYGDGIFETIKVCEGKILFEVYHFERLFLGLQMLQIKNFLQPQTLSSEILDLCKKNNCTQLARVRLAVYRNEKNTAGYAIEALALSPENNQWNEKGLAIGVYPFARKSADAFSNLKTANFLPYVLAGLYAKEKGWDDAIVLNAQNYICDTSKANIFLIRENEIYTPALHQGCISGVVRRFLTDELKRTGIRVHQKEISEQDLLEADEVFLTNSIYEMRWVASFRNKNYLSQQGFSFYQKLCEWR